MVGGCCWNLIVIRNTIFLCLCGLLLFLCDVVVIGVCLASAFCLLSKRRRGVLRKNDYHLHSLGILIYPQFKF